MGETNTPEEEVQHGEQENVSVGERGFHNHRGPECGEDCPLYVSNDDHAVDESEDDIWPDDCVGDEVSDNTLDTNPDDYYEEGDEE